MAEAPTEIAMNYTVDDYLDAMIAAHGGAPGTDWQKRHQARLEALHKAFSRPSDGSEPPRYSAAADEALRCSIDGAATLRDPFSGWSECPPEVYEIIRAPAGRGTDFLKAAREEYRALARSVLALPPSDVGERFGDVRGTAVVRV